MTVSSERPLAVFIMFQVEMMGAASNKGRLCSTALRLILAYGNATIIASTSHWPIAMPQPNATVLIVYLTMLPFNDLTEACPRIPLPLAEASVERVNVAEEPETSCFTRDL